MKLEEELTARDCRRVLVGMSGGLDSTYTAYLLTKCGCTVGGAMLKMFPELSTEAAQTAAQQAGVPLNILDVADTFQKQVIDNFTEEYAAGRTPNPCIRCNRYVKIAALCDFAEANGFDHVATGHYADIVSDAQTGRWFVRRGDDLKKDQSYVLWNLTQKQLSMLLTPLFHLNKADIRAQAASLGFTCAESKESQDICFIPDGDYAAFVARACGAFPPGDFVTPDGMKVGTHKGLIHYTVGQRKHLGLAMNSPVFITAIDPASNCITVDYPGGEYGRTMRVSQLNGQKRLPAAGDTVRALVKIRYAAPPVPCTVRFDTDETAEVAFDEPVRAVTPGQSAVFYDMDFPADLLFGGLIEGS